MYEKKYDMTREENVFWAKRNLVDYIWKSANLEGIAVTFRKRRRSVKGSASRGKALMISTRSCSSSAAGRCCSIPWMKK